MKKNRPCNQKVQSIINLIDGLNTAIGKAVSWCSLLLVIFVTIDVALRYGFNISFVALGEAQWHLYAIIFLLGAGYTLKDNGHVRVDVIYQRLGKRARAIINLLGIIFFLIPGCFLVIKTSIPFVKASWMVSEGSPDPGGLPARYILKAMIPIAFLLLSIQGVSMFLKNLCILFSIRIEGKRST